MHLLMFDVDGTLVHSNDYDADCFVRAVVSALGIPTIDRDWGGYEHVTDSGILHEIMLRECGREPTEEEVRRVQDRFFSELDSVLNGSHCSSAPVAGAIDFLARLALSPTIATAIATGGWEASCRKKLVKSGFSVDRIPLASANDAMSRIEIMNCSLRKAKMVYRQQAFQSITYVGDASWDIKASEKLGWNFIGVGAPMLSFVDARPRHWIGDFTDRPALDRIFDAIGITTRSMRCTDEGVV